MKRLITFLIIPFFTIPLLAQVKEVTPLIFGKKYTIYSKVLKENRTILVYDPNENLKREKKIDRPVIYVLDGNDHYLNIINLLLGLGGDSLPKLIVVGITQNDRNKDLSSEGFSQFSSYIESEIMSYIDSHYKTSNDKILIGHSLGGLFTMSTFLQKNNLFNSYISIDPYLINQNIPSQYLELSKINTFKNKSLYISIARTFPENLTFEEAVNDISDSTKMVREIVSLVNQIDSNRKELHFKCDYFNDKGHMSVPNISIYNGLKFIFNN